MCWSGGVENGQCIGRLGGKQVVRETLELGLLESSSESLESREGLMIEAATATGMGCLHAALSMGVEGHKKECFSLPV